MTLENVFAKVIPVLVISYMVVISGLIIKVNTLENKESSDDMTFDEYKKEKARIEQKQWEFIMNTNKGVLQLQERVPQCLTKEQYYKEKVCPNR